jgi:UDP-glucose 4-epimerase
MNDGNAASGSRILVTGGSGFIGSHLVRTLLGGGADVIVADLVPHPDQRVTSIAIDLTTPGAVEEVVQPGLDAVVHLAAVTSVLRSVEKPIATLELNVMVTAKLVERARQVGISNFVFASSAAVFGRNESYPYREDTILSPLTPYGATKAAAEMALSPYSSGPDIICNTLRFTNTYGPGMVAKDSVVPRLCRCIRAGTTFDVYGQGDLVRDYLFVDDAVSAVLLALGPQLPSPLMLGSSRSLSILELVDSFRQVTGEAVPVRHVEAKAGEMKAVIVDPSLARSLGWQPSVTFEEGLALTWANWPESTKENAARSR